ncbi:hypothetical protein [Cellulomonas sp. SG140]|uniref:hypothetical protein n=1 Tax=Cellulomonas sp. SG140 TaxID=2976536 RepID=UPI0021E826D4|nr:hypothetical protein [Cellulomonas sp. SG140]
MYSPRQPWRRRPPGRVTSAPFALTGWQQWSHPSVPVQVGADGAVTVTVTGSLSGGAWGAVDEVQLVRAHPTVDRQR